MNGICLRLYVQEGRKVHGKLLYEWLLDGAKKLGIRGGTALKAMAGYGRHGTLHEARFFELAGDQTVEVEFFATTQEAESLLALLRTEGVNVFYAKVAAEFGVLE